MARPLMLDLVQTVYWFDEQLQNRLNQLGWHNLNRSESLVLVNIANGETRAARIAENLGVSRQAMSQILAALESRKLIALARDPGDRRARVASFAPESAHVREDALTILNDLEAQMASIVGTKAVNTIRLALTDFLRSIDDSASDG